MNTLISLITSFLLLHCSNAAIPGLAGNPNITYNPWAIMFDNVTTGDGVEGLTLEFDIGKNKTAAQFKAKILDENCTAPVMTDMSVYVNDTWVMPGMPKENETMAMYDKAKVQVYINDTTVEDSPFWTNISETQGVIKFCVRSELMLEELYNGTELSISFADTKVYSSVNFMAGFASFEITDINITKNDAYMVEQETELEVRSCICDVNAVCIDTPTIEQNDEFNICVIPEGDDLYVKTFHAVALEQDNVAKFYPVLNDEIMPLTNVQYIDSKGVVTTRLISVFFTSEDPSDLFVTGEVLLDFKERRRALAEKDSKYARLLESGSGKAQFTVSAGVVPKPESALDAFQVEKIQQFVNDNLGVAMTGFVCLAVVIMVYRSDNDDEEQEDENKTKYDKLENEDEREI